MLKVGVTGGIGSGKTTFCKKLEELGAYVLYADDFARELMVTDKQLIQEIKSIFGKKAYLESGELNKSYLAEEAFAKGRVEELNELVHPVLWERSKELYDSKEKEGYNVFVKEAAVLLNNGRPEELDYVVLLRAPKKERISRVMDRDKTREQLIADRINQQPDFDALIPLCDFVIDNDSDISSLKEEAIKFYENIAMH